jgi:hypothetical protein
VSGDGVAGRGSETGDSVDDTCRETGLLDEVAHVQGGERGELGWLHDDGASGRERGSDLPRPHHERVVPWDTVVRRVFMS